MIVEPDFLTHWKTQQLAAELNDPAAALYVIALWGHCQQRKTDVFAELRPNMVKAICRFPGDGQALLDALVICGFVDEEEGAYRVHGWADVNAKLVANWINGPRGGRPPKNPTVTHEKPNGNPRETDKIDKIDLIEKKDEKREATSGKPKRPLSRAQSSEEFVAELKADPIYAGIDVDREFAKMVRWCGERGKQATRRRLINWLNNADTPMTGKPNGKSDPRTAVDRDFARTGLAPQHIPVKRL